jgi:hypothetical protein
MKFILATLWVETLKIRKSGIFWATILFFIIVSSMMSLVMFVQKNPEISAKLGMIGDKASMLRFGEPNWQNYFRLLIEGMQLNNSSYIILTFTSFTGLFGTIAFWLHADQK